MAAASSSGVSCWLRPSVSKIAWRSVAGLVAKICRASCSHFPIAVPPPARSPLIARLASARVCGLAIAMVPLAGYTGLAKLVPAMTANHTPSLTTSTAAEVALRAWVILVCGTSIDPEQSMMMISALPDPALATAASPGVPSDVTVAMALTSRAPS